MASEADLPAHCVTLGLAPSFGFGDRIGLATPGHVEAMRRSGSGIDADLPPAVDPRDGPDVADAPERHGRRPPRGDQGRRLDRPDRRRCRSPQDAQATSTRPPPPASPSSRSTRPARSTPMPTTTTSPDLREGFAAVADRSRLDRRLSGQVDPPADRHDDRPRPRRLASGPPSSTAGRSTHALEPRRSHPGGERQGGPRLRDRAEPSTRPSSRRRWPSITSSPTSASAGG